MKKTILAIALITASAAVHAQRFIMTTPELLTSVGVTVDSNDAVAVRFTGQETLCYNARFCFNPSATFMSVNDNTLPDFDNEPGDRFNMGAGFDVKYKFPKKRNNALYVEAGPVVFVRPLRQQGDNNLNLHVGAGVEYRRFTLSVDAYGTDSALTMVTGGYRF